MSILAVASSGTLSHITQTVSSVVNSLWNVIKICFNAIALFFSNPGRIIVCFVASVGTYFGVSTTIAAIGITSLAILAIALLVIYGIKKKHITEHYYQQYQATLAPLSNQIVDDKFIRPSTSDTALSGTTLGKQAIEFARAKLREYPQISPFKFSAQPINKEIALLTTLYFEIYFRAFENAIFRTPKEENPWNKKDVIKAADDCMKISYAISCLTLEDLPDYTKKTRRSPAEALTRQDSYQYRTFYYCTDCYHWFRSAIVWEMRLKHAWNKDLEQYEDSLKKQLIYQSIPQDHVNLFYEKGTIHNQWNALYNEYCDKIRSYVTESDLQEADPRHARWTQKDVDPTVFSMIPDTQPT